MTQASHGVLYLEDLSPGQSFLSAGRTITESDVVAFAGLSGDWNPIHTDVEFARQSVYGQRVVYGMLGVSIATGLLDRMGLFSGSAIAMLGIKDWVFAGPIFISDTVRLRLTIQAIRPSASKPDRGIVTIRFTLLNETGEAIMSHVDTVLVRRRSLSTAPPKRG